MATNLPGQRQVNQRGTGAPQYGSFVDIPQVDNGAGTLAQGVASLAGSIAKVQQEADAVQVMGAENDLNKFINDSTFDQQNGYLIKKGINSIDVPETYGGMFQKRADEIRQSLANDAQRKIFDQRVAQLGLDFKSRLQKHTFDEMQTYKVNQTNSAIEMHQNNAALYFNDPNRVEMEVGEARKKAQVWSIINGVSSEEAQAKQKDVVSAVRLSAFSRMADSDPGAARSFFEKHKDDFTAQDLLKADGIINPAMRKQTASNIARNVFTTSVLPQDINSATEFIIDIEGGDKLVTDSGGLTKFGISQNSYPGLDIANLTREQAAEIIKKDYYAKVVTSDMTEAMKLVSADAAMNHGPAMAKKMIEQSGGDPRVLIDLREKEYRRLASENPEKYGGYINGWLNRLAKLNEAISVGRGELPPLSELTNKALEMTDDPDIAANSVQLIKSRYDAIQNDKKNRNAAAADEAWSYVSSGQDVPASVQARMDPKELSDMLNSSGITDPVVYENARSSILSGNDVDLSRLRWKLGAKYDELVKLKQDPNRQIGERNLQDLIGDVQPVILGKTKPDSPEDYAKVERFRARVQQEIGFIQGQTSKPLSQQEQRDVVYRMLYTGSISGPGRGWFGSSGSDTGMMYEAKPGETFAIEGIPFKEGKAYVIDGVPLTYDEFIGRLTQGLRQRNIAPTQENLVYAYNVYSDRMSKNGGAE